MNLKIMVTGRNRRIATDICEHISSEREYSTIKCPPTKSAIFEMSLSELPHVVIICAGDESADSVKAYDVLRETVKIGALEIIIVANDEDRKAFMNNSKLTISTTQNQMNFNQTIHEIPKSKDLPILTEINSQHDRIRKEITKRKI